jgi:LPXTG-motif cell wall-anchored protein
VTEAKDGNCVAGPNKAVDCVCDLDCPASGDNADPDCANVAPKTSNSGWIVFLFIGLLFIVIVVIIIVIIRRRSNEEEVELP